MDCFRRFLSREAPQEALPRREHPDRSGSIAASVPPIPAPALPAPGRHGPNAQRAPTYAPMLDPATTSTAMPFSSNTWKHADVRQGPWRRRTTRPAPRGRTQSPAPNRRRSARNEPLGWPGGPAVVEVRQFRTSADEAMPQAPNLADQGVEPIDLLAVGQAHNRLDGEVAIAKPAAEVRASAGRDDKPPRGWLGETSSHDPNAAGPRITRRRQPIRQRLEKP